MSEVHKGLKGIVVDTTQMSAVDGEQGRLIYRGYDIHELAGNSNFEEVAYLLLHGALPTASELTSFAGQLVENRPLPEALLAIIHSFPKTASMMDALRTVISAVSLHDPEIDDMSREASLQKAINLISKVASTIAACHRVREEKAPVDPDPNLSHAANFLYMLSGTPAGNRSAEIFDVCLVLHADHGFNASTFSSRVTASTKADMYSAVCAAISTLKGPLHGGANQAVMNMLLEIGEPDRAQDYVEGVLSRKERVMGFGHRVYKTEDPRVTHLRRFSKELGEATGDVRWYEISERLEEIMREEKGLNCNVDFYSASVYHLLGIERDIFPSLFAASRIAGWCGHILEQYADNALIRPRAQYEGKRDRSYDPIEQR